MLSKERFVMLWIVLALAGLSFFAAPQVSAQGRWIFVNRMPAHVGRAGLAAATGLDGAIYAIGGLTIGDPNVVKTVEAYNPRTNTWSIKAQMPTARTGLAAATGLDGRIYAIGGCLTSDGYTGLNTVEVYNPATNSWSSAAPMPTARTGLAAVTGPDGRIYAIGGYNFMGGHFNAVEVYNPLTNSWATAAPMPTARQSFGATLGPDGRIYAIGGTNQWRQGILNTAEAFDTANNTWTTIASMPTARDGVGVTAGPGGLIYAVGGFSFESGPFGDVTGTVEAYNLTTNSWSTLSPLLVPEYGPATVTGLDCRVYAIGGGGYGVSSLVQALTARRQRCGFTIVPQG